MKLKPIKVLECYLKYLCLSLYKETCKRSLRLTVFFLPVLIQAQIDNNGCVGGNFGIDAGVYSGSIEYGDGTPAIDTNDWFLGTSGFGVIDESQTTALTNLLTSGGNPTYEVRMNTGFSSLVNQQIRIEAVFARDFFGGSGHADQTSFETAAKNSEDPASWNIGQSGVLGKNDLIDVAGFMFRNGEDLINGTPSDLWFVGLINRAEPGGNAYMDFEFYAKDVKFNSSPEAGDPGEGNFDSGGPDMGHTAFQFDPATGEITQVGDFIFNTSLEGGITPNVEMRLWVSYQDYTTITPAGGFTWGPEFDGAFQGAPYGYASIIPAVNDICGIINQSGENPQTPPWGSLGTKNNTYITEYQDYSVVEVGVNMTAIGIDHASLQGTNPCDFPLNTFIVKTRTSSAFSSGLKDFVGPFEWTFPTNQAIIISSNPLISCDNTQVELSVDPLRTDVQYNWTTVDGSIVSDPALSTITVDKPGTYVLHAFLPTGCPIDDAEVTVQLDPSKPFINPPTAVTTVACSGNDGSIDLTVTGGTAPFSFEWYESGNGTPISTIEDPVNLSPGNYYVIVTDDISCTITSTTFTIEAKQSTNISGVTNDVDCNGSNTGAIDVTVSGNGPYTFLWSNGVTTEDVAGLQAGLYTITTTDADGCIDQASFTVSEPDVLDASTTITHDTDPDPGVSNSSIDLVVTGGTTPYTYDWDYNGAEDPDSDPQDPNGLNAGTYTVVITDANGCTTTAIAIVYEPEICNDGTDNDGDGLTDCEDPDCSVTTPGTITPSSDPVCVGDTGITYSITDTGADTYTWMVPSGAIITSGQGTTSITANWIDNVGGQICVYATKDGCDSPSSSCYTVTLNDVPPIPDTINVEDN